MNKADKRQRSIRNKLMAATAMLLVASIMTVTTTYAWFTLSTAPEVQGITTTVGANGSLEIALANPVGDNSQIGTKVGDANRESWVLKNQTWGNLLDLSSELYALNEITLLPAQLNVNQGNETTPNTLNGSPLRIPVYGSDGRISELDGNLMQYGTQDPSGKTDGFLVLPNIVFEDGKSIPNYPGYGVRALGTSSTMSPTQLNYQTALNAVNTYRGQANGLASDAIFKYGYALADIAILRQNEKDGSEVNYYDFLDEMDAMLVMLQDASDVAEKALLNAMIAITNAKIPYNNATLGEAIIPGSTLSVRDYVKQNTDMTAIWNNIDASMKEALEDKFSSLDDAYNTWEGINSKITDTLNAVKALQTDHDDDKEVAWTEMSPVLNGLMNTSNVTLCGMSLDNLDKNELVTKLGDLSLELGTGSGVLADFGALTGNLSAKITLSDSASYAGVNLGGAPIALITDSEPAGGPLLTQVRGTIALIGPAGDTGSTTSIDVTYGYVLDFVFRTNAANSNLLLQTEEAQRIYEDATNVATMGGGSTMTFDGTSNNIQSLLNMMNGIRVVFTNTTGDTKEVYGIAKLLLKDTPVSMTVTAVDREVSRVLNEVKTDDKVTGHTYSEGTVEFKDGAATAQKVSVSSTGRNDLSYVLNGMGEHQYVVVEMVEEEDGTTYQRLAVKTAVTYTATVATTVAIDVTDPSIADPAAQTKPETTVTFELVDALTGLPIFYEDLDINGDGDDDYYKNLAAAQAETIVTGDTVEGDVTTKTTVSADDKDNKYYDDLALNIGDRTEDATGAVKYVKNTSASVAIKYTPENSTTEYDATETTTTVITVDDPTDSWATNHATSEPDYYHVYDQNITVEGKLYLHNYEVSDAGVMSFGEPKAVQTLTALDQNAVKDVTALVYLDGDYVDNADVTNSADGIANTGTLNLQFASSANLVPMENTDLKNGKNVAVNWSNPAGATYVAQETKYATLEQDYEFGLDKEYTVTVSFANEDVADLTLSGEATTITVGSTSVNGYKYTIPAANITKDNGEITITITENP